MGCSTLRRNLRQGSSACRFNGRILLANPLQSSKRTFSWGSFLSFFAFKEGMRDTQIAALLSSPTVSGLGVLGYNLLSGFVLVICITVRMMPSTMTLREDAGRGE